MKDKISKTIDFRRWTIFDGQWSVVYSLPLKQTPLCPLGREGSLVVPPKLNALLKQNSLCDYREDKPASLFSLLVG
jgi:hypothetical protein